MIVRFISESPAVVFDSFRYFIRSINYQKTNLSSMAADECNIRVVARFRPLNDSEERAGSKSVVRFPADQEETVLISV